MSKKEKLHIVQIDFQSGISQIIPTTDFSAKEEEKKQLREFKKTLSSQIDVEIKKYNQFPSNNQFFIFIIQYFISEKEYNQRDIDNMAKTILDTLKGRFYKDDNQVKTLLIGKKIEKRVPRNFAYFALKELKDGHDIDVLKVSGLERSVTLYNEFKSRHLC